MPSIERFVEVRDGAAVLVERKVLRAVSIESLRQSLVSTDIRTPILPPNIFYLKSGEDAIVAITRDQGSKEVQFLTEAPVRIFMPTRVYFVLLQNGQITKIYQFLSKMIPSKDADVLWHAPLANRFESGEICIRGLNLVGQSTPLAERLDNVIDQVEATRYNNDLAGIGVEFAPEVFRTMMGPSTNFKHMLQAWAACTVEKAPEAMLNIGWMPAKTFGQYTSGRLE